MTARRLLPTVCLLLLLLAVSPAPARADTSPTALSAAPVLFAENVTWRGFVKYWTGYANRADRIVLIVAIVGGLAFFIIARGKWR